MDRATLVKWWDEAWESGLWWAPWSKALADLTPAQAAWRPAPGRHSIWQIVHHLVFWREHELRLLAGGARATDEQIAAGNFAEPAPVTDVEWGAARDRLAAAQRRLRDAFADPAVSLERASYLLPHDIYHYGQIMDLRALQGLAPVV
jgi:hypothetical protein